ncbi:MAG: DotU family type IV/VI secretion system protein [Planctomycetes bacterium]|nr:DotU family type IV/VI secretion system protein [Planctomycetota bacterium]
MTTTDQGDRPSLRLTTACWPILEFTTNFGRQVKHGTTPPPDQGRYEALSAFRDAEELSRDEPAVERLWEDRAKAMMVYMLDYKMINTPWEGSEYWADNPFETDPQILDHAQATGGEDFFRDCDEIQREYELAERRERRDRHELAELLGLYFVCLRLGFKGQYHDRPQELADYTRRLFTRLPAYAVTRAKEMFPETYEHNQEAKVNYNLGMSLTVVLVTFVVILGLSLGTFRIAWSKAVKDIRVSATQWKQIADGEEPTVEVEAPAESP